MGFPWWLWLVIILVILFIIIIAVLLLLCLMCGCCACCADCCPCCAALCEDACGCCAPFCGPFAACIAACCPCCCEDEDDCARCWLKCCCGASACVCCGSAYRERRKAKGSANLVGYHPVSQNGKVIGSTGPVPPDLWINHEGVEMKKTDSKKGGITVSSKEEERERLEKGGGVDQQRDQVQETSFTQSSVQNQQERHVSPVGGYDYHGSTPRQHQMDRPAYMYPTNTTSSGYHSDTNTTSSHDDGSSTQGSTSRGGNPLTSFSVPGPPPNYQPAKVKIQAPAYSPLKRTQQAGVARVRHQPLPVVTPRAPDVTYRGVGDGTSPGAANRSFSTEDLNTEMLNLEGLMKDLNAITASELQS